MAGNGIYGAIDGMVVVVGVGGDVDVDGDSGGQWKLVRMVGRRMRRLPG